ncbi:MAG: DUF2513 domain-containing protein [Pirellulales bacterium]
MQRDIDLLRHLLLEIERRGATSPIDTLRADVRHDGDERIRYHLRLLTDAGYLKEAGQTSTGTPCVRLTHEGQEFIELARSDARWREAKATVLAATGGVPLTVVRSLLGKWAWRSVVRNERRRVVVGRRRYHRYVERVAPEVWLDAYATDPDALWDDGQSRAARERATIRRRRVPAAWDPALYDDVAAELDNAPAAEPLPEHLI